MEYIKKDEVENALEAVPDLPVKKNFKYAEAEEFYPEQILDEVKRAMEQPVELQKELGAKLKLYLDYQIAHDMQEYGKLSPFTREWIKTYNGILSDVQKNQYGDKSVHLHVGQVTHAHIASALRRAKEGDSEVIDSEVKK